MYNKHTLDIMFTLASNLADNCTIHNQNPNFHKSKILWHSKWSTTMSLIPKCLCVVIKHCWGRTGNLHSFMYGFGNLCWCLLNRAHKFFFFLFHLYFCSFSASCGFFRSLLFFRSISNFTSNKHFLNFLMVLSTRLHNSLYICDTISYYNFTLMPENFLNIFFF